MEKQPNVPQMNETKLKIQQVNFAVHEYFAAVAAAQAALQALITDPEGWYAENYEEFNVEALCHVHPRSLFLTTNSIFFWICSKEVKRS